MANNKKISQLTSAGALTGTELVPVVQGGVTVQTTTQDIADLGGSSTTPNLAQVLTEGYTANSSVLLTDGTATELLLDPSYIQLKSLGLGSILFDADAILDVVNYKGNELATLNDIPSLTGYEQTVNKDATGGYVGLTALKINFKNVLNTFTSFFTNSNTAARTYTFQDRNGTIADDTDLGLKSPIASPTFTGTVTTPAIIVSSETASRVAIIDASKNVKSADTTTYPSLTELSYGKGVTSSIQTQLNNKGSSTPVYSTKWLTAPFATLPNSIGNFAGAIFYIPISVSKTMTLTDLRMEVTAGVAASNIRLAIYNDNNGAPSTLLDQSTAISSAVIGQKDYTLVSPITIQASDQKFWLAVQASVNGVGLRSSTSGVCLNLLAGSGGTGVMSYEIQAFGAFPATSTPTLNPSQQVILMAAKLQ